MKEGDVIWHWRTWQKSLRAWRWENLVSQSSYSDTVIPVFGWFLTVCLIVGLFRTIHNVPARKESVKIPVDRVVKVPGLSGDGEVDASAVAEASKPLRNREQRRGGSLESGAKTGKKKSRKQKKKTGSRKDLRKKKGKGSFFEDSADEGRVERESAFSGLAKTEFAESFPRSDENETFSASSGERVVHVSPEVAGDSSTVTGLEEREAGSSGFESQEAESQAARSRGKKRKGSRTGLLQSDATLLGRRSQSSTNEGNGKRSVGGATSLLRGVRRVQLRGAEYRDWT